MMAGGLTIGPWFGLAIATLVVIGVVVHLWRHRPAAGMAFGLFAALAVVVTLGLLAVDEVAQARDANTWVERSEQ